MIARVGLEDFQSDHSQLPIQVMSHYGLHGNLENSPMEIVEPNDIYDPSIQDNDNLISVERKFMRKMMKEKYSGDYRYYFHQILLCIVMSIVLFVHFSHHYISLEPRVPICRTIQKYVFRCIQSARSEYTSSFCETTHYIVLSSHSSR
jgi:hypothetical protein